MSIQPTLNFSFSRFVLMIATLVAISCASQTVSAQAAKSRKIHITLKQMVAKEKIPGMIAAICDADGVLSIGSVGVRKEGAKAAFAKDDVVHIGSCTKALTSMMLATLVADGTMTWNTTLIEVFPEYMNNVHAGYHNVTLWELITHRAGIPENAIDWWVHTNRPIKERRLAILAENLKKASEVSRGEYHYSNLGYLVAGCMAEKLSGSTWESLMQERVFNPLSMTSAGFGPPGAASQVDQPWGHIKSESQDRWQPMQHDNAEALGPAGRVHCTMEDWAKFVSPPFTSGDRRTQLPIFFADLRISTA